MNLSRQRWLSQWSLYRYVSGTPTEWGWCRSRHWEGVSSGGYAERAHELLKVRDQYCPNERHRRCLEQDRLNWREPLPFANRSWCRRDCRLLIGNR